MLLIISRRSIANCRINYFLLLALVVGGCHPIVLSEHYKKLKLLAKNYVLANINYQLVSENTSRSHPTKYQILSFWWVYWTPSNSSPTL